MKLPLPKTTITFETIIMFITILVFISVVILACTSGYHSYVLAQLLKQQQTTRPGLQKKKWKFTERMVPSHLVKKEEQADLPEEKQVLPLATLESESMEYEDKMKLIDALTKEDTTI